MLQILFELRHVLSCIFSVTSYVLQWKRRREWQRVDLLQNGKYSSPILVAKAVTQGMNVEGATETQTMDEHCLLACALWGFQLLHTTAHGHLPRATPTADFLNLPNAV